MAQGKSNKPDYATQVAESIIQQLREGTAPWAKPWKPNEYQMPHNPVTGTVYKGINHWHLASRPHSDPRWMTYKQAEQAGYQVKKGSKATTVQYWKFNEQHTKKDENGNEVKDEQGKPVKITVKLERPRTFYAKVFNAEQIEGMPPLKPKAPPAWNPSEKAETILSNSGADIRHDQADRAYYSPVKDSIHLPKKEQFETSDNYYATALHELGHWTGHKSRLDRDLSHPFGTPGYAKEELRAEIGSFMFNQELGLGHDPGQHTAYVGSWIKALQEDPQEIFRAASDAEKIKNYVLDLAQKQTLEQDLPEQTKAQDKPAISPDIQEELKRFHATSNPGYSPLESWENLQAVAKEIGLVAHIDKSPSSEQGTSWNITYSHNGKPTSVTTELSSDGKALTAQDGERMSGTGSTSDKDWQRDQLTGCYELHRIRKTLLSEEETQEILARDSFGALSGYSPMETWKNLKAVAEERGLEASVQLNKGEYQVKYTDNGKPTGLTSDFLGDGKARSFFEGERAGEYAMATPSKPEQASNLNYCIDRYHFVTQMRASAVQAQAADEEPQMSPPKTAAENTPLAVPYTQRNEAKRLAGKLPSGENALGWDKENKTWYAKPGADLDALKQFLPENVNSRQAPIQSAEGEFADTLKANGFILEKGHPVIDGKWHRVSVEGDKPGQTSGAYRAYGDGRPAGHYQNHREHDEPIKWVAKGQRLSDTERAKLQAESATKTAQRQAEQARKYDHHAKRCQQVWSRLAPAKGNAYLANKGVKDFGARMDKKGRLVVPLRNSQGEIRSLQRISSNGFKSLKKGAEKQGNFHVLNGHKLASSPCIFHAEGYSTGASIAEATTMPVVLSIDAGNLPAVVKQFQEMYPDKGQVIAGDDDRFKEKNKGRKKAEEAAELAGPNARATFPRFGNGNPDKLTDFNDLHQHHGIEAVKNQLRPVVQNLLNQMKSGMEQKSQVQKIDNEKQTVSKSR
ncbi:zincin-like metallopeptidase domain-containing protein [Microbulbifer aggregans]|uniref:zincin-like metallopeptidase domain-containing protein n=1 Tax=Microbulbifer aggregans TaxID=1769779 RepID=UPI001CFD46C2|nr:zincin-like metallopeptidase domain-containing protein [Microbulbifer aggregans]